MKLLLGSLAAAVAIGAMLPRDPPASGPQGSGAGQRSVSTAHRSEIANHADLREHLQHDASAPITDKYAPLLEALNPSVKSDVQAMLIAREGVDPANSRRLGDLERELSLMLSSGDYALYEQLRESGPEQESIRSFAQSLEHTSPLSTQQQRSLLLARLRSKDAVASLELQASMTDAESTNMEDIYALDLVTVGLAHYREQFLTEARSFLSDEQWTALLAQQDQDNP